VNGRNARVKDSSSSSAEAGWERRRCVRGVKLVFNQKCSFCRAWKIRTGSSRRAQNARKNASKYEAEIKAAFFRCAKRCVQTQSAASCSLEISRRGGSKSLAAAFLLRKSPLWIYFDSFSHSCAIGRLSVSHLLYYYGALSAAFRLGKRLLALVSDCAQFSYLFISISFCVT